MSNVGSVILYIFILLISGFFFSFYKSRRKGIRDTGVFLSIIIPTIFAGVRYNVGTDYGVYNSIFTLLRSVSLGNILVGNYNRYSMRVERGFLILSKICTCFFSNKMIFAVMACVTISIFVYTLLTQYRNYNLTICYIVFLFSAYTSSLNIMRQYLAVVLVFYGLRFVFENKPVKFGLVVLFAATFHVTAILAFPMWFFWDHKANKKINNQIAILFFVAAILIVSNWKNLLRFVLSFNMPFISKYGGYLVGNAANNRSFYIQVAMAFVMLFLTKYIKHYDNRVEYFVYLYLIGVIIEYTGFYITYVKRVGIYYFVTEALLLSLYPKAFHEKSDRIVGSMVCIFEIVYFILSAFVLGQSGLIPYRWK